MIIEGVILLHELCILLGSIKHILEYINKKWVAFTALLITQQ